MENQNKLKIDELLDSLVDKDRVNRKVLEVNSSRYQALFNNPFDAVLILNSSYDIVEYNNKTIDILGETPKGKSLLSYLKNKDEFTLQSVTGKISILATKVGKFKNKVVEIYGQRLLNSLSSCGGYYVIIRDITDRINDYKKLNMENKLYSDIVGSFPDTLIMFDDLGNILYNSGPNLLDFGSLDNIKNLGSEPSGLKSLLQTNLELLKLDNQTKTFDFTLQDKCLSARLAFNAGNYLLLLRDITYIRNLEKEIVNQNSILDVLISSVETLFIDPNYDRVLLQVLVLLSELFGIKYSFIFNNDFNSNDIIANMKYNYTYNNEPVDKKYNKLSISKYIKPEILSSILDSRVTLLNNSGFNTSFMDNMDHNIYLSPIYTKDVFWGSLVLVLDEDRVFSKTEESIILLVSKLLSNYIQNYSQTNEVHTLYKLFTSDKNSILWTDVSGNFIFANDSFCKKFPDTNSIFEITKISRKDWDNLVDYLRDKKITKHCYDLFLDSSFINTEVNLCYLKYLDREFIVCS